MNCCRIVRISLGFFYELLLLWICDRIIRISLGFDHRFVYVDMSQNQNQGDVQLNKNEGDEKKKAKSPMTWHKIECDGSVKKRVRMCRRTIIPGWGGAGGHAILVLNQKQVLRDCQGQPNWLVWRGRWLNVMACNV